MDAVALLALGRSVEDEAVHLAADLAITPYEAGVMLRAPMPIVVLRSEDRARTLDLLGRLRGRGHDAVACDLGAVSSSETMFRPRSFRFEGADFVGIGNGEEHRLALGEVVALVRAKHRTRVEDTVTRPERKLSLGRAAMSGGLLLTKVAAKESKRVTDEQEAILYLFRGDGAPWLLGSSQLRFDGLAERMRRSTIENFDVLVHSLRELAPAAPFDDRLLSVRAPTNIVAGGPKHTSASSSGTIDLLAHLVALSLGRAARPYR